MDRPVIIGIADGPQNPNSESLSQVDFVLFGDWPKTFESHRVTGGTPEKWRHSPLVIAEATAGIRRLTGTNVVWGKDNAELAGLIKATQLYAGKVVVITGEGDGSASRAAKKCGAHVEVLTAGRMVKLSSFGGKITVLSSSGEAKVQAKQKKTVQKKFETPKKTTKSKPVEAIEAADDHK